MGVSILQLNPSGLVAGSEGYITSITFISGGVPVTYTPDANNQIGATGNQITDAAATVLSGASSGQNARFDAPLSLVVG